MRRILHARAYDAVYQILYAIFLVVHAAEASVVESPERLPDLLTFIHTQSQIGLDELRSVRDLI